MLGIAPVLVIYLLVKHVRASRVDATHIAVVPAAHLWLALAGSKQEFKPVQRRRVFHKARAAPHRTAQK